MQIETTSNMQEISQPPSPKPTLRQGSLASQTYLVQINFPKYNGLKRPPQNCCQHLDCYYNMIDLPPASLPPQNSKVSEAPQQPFAKNLTQVTWSKEEQKIYDIIVMRSFQITANVYSYWTTIRSMNQWRGKLIDQHTIRDLVSHHCREGPISQYSTRSFHGRTPYQSNDKVW